MISYPRVNNNARGKARQAGAFRPETVAASTCEVEVFRPQLDASQIRSKPGERFRLSEQTVDLASAPLIVS